ncbi:MULTISPECIES: alpha/beta hydrolase [unclassified Streptomyces]|uniref:alpha/beta hydrolase n=1 Tax=unclassified Streptomyces TaxID=2593676 RepID=UPI0029AA7824|nr:MULTISPECIES: alpha/beta hydrolase [unclassified Streptomyces]MDX3772305.1 alpha/beta hydrolase [Streptomyces sp. AK08-01B]MDX3821700.1 alpha/beta hydrolase [Streptomyces sp. AK08-01A]
MTLPSLLLVPGAWHKPEHLQLLIDDLPDIDVHTVALTTCGDDPKVLGDMYSDAAAIKSAVEAIDGPVVVVAHSYGGIPTTQALVETSNVKSIVYLAAFQLDAGDSLLSSVGGNPAPWWNFHRQEGFGDFLTVAGPVDVFYGDVDRGVAEKAAAALGYQSYIAKTQKLTAAAWRTIPSTYIICEADKAIPPFAQEHFARRANRTLRMESSHSPFLSQPSALAQLIKHELTLA